MKPPRLLNPRDPWTWIIATRSCSNGSPNTKQKETFVSSSPWLLYENCRNVATCSFYNHSFSTIHVAQCLVTIPNGQLMHGPCILMSSSNSTKLNNHSDRTLHVFSLDRWLSSHLFFLLFLFLLEKLTNWNGHLYYLPSTRVATGLTVQIHQSGDIFVWGSNQGRPYLPEKDWTPRKRDVTLIYPDKDHRRPAPF